VFPLLFLNPAYYFCDKMVGMNDVGNTNTVLLLWTIISGIVGILGFLLALYLKAENRRLARLPLHMSLREVSYKGSLADRHLVLLSLAFVNPSSVGKTVFHIVGGAPNKEDLKPYLYQRMQGQTEVEMITPNGEKKLIIPILELLCLPLDIPPHQSRTGYYPALIQTHHQNDTSQALPVLIKTPNSVNSHPQVHLLLRAYDVLGKQIAEIDQNIELKTYQLF